MLNSIDIGRLYERVLDNDIEDYNISPEAVKFGIECMQHVYSGETSGLRTNRSQIADYTDPAHRCAYLHKYAALHTAMVRDMLGETINEHFGFFRQLVFTGEPFKICSLGGGPGTDVIGALSALHAAFGYFECSATVVDYMAEWSFSFGSILKELGSGMYGAFGNRVSRYLNWRYVGANLLKSLKNEVIEGLSTASLVTMIKFTSAAACKDTYKMIKNIFTAMKPGAVLLFIDNDGGGFHKLIEDAAIEYNFMTIFGPLRRENYLNSFFKSRKFGYNSCCKTTVTVHVLQKPIVMDPYYNFPNTFMNSYVPANLMSPRQSLLGSPPTPFLYLGQSPDANYTKPANSPLLPYPGPCTLRSPLAAYDHNLDKNSNRLSYASAYDVKNQFLQNENMNNAPNFVSPIEDIQSSSLQIVPSRIVTPLTPNFVNSPRNTTFRRSVYTPDTQPRGGKRARMQGCFPLKIRNFRHHIASRLNQVKSRARSVFKKNKKNKTHPIFKL